MPLNTINASVLSGPTNLLAMGHPFVRPSYAQVPGFPFAIDVHSREIVMFDPWLLQNAGVIHSAFGLVIGPKKHGKSSTLKILSLRCMMASAGYDRVRVWINDYKPEGKSSEYDRYTKLCRSIVYQLSEGRVNFFERKLFMTDDNELFETGILSIAEMFCEFVFGKPLIGDRATALRVAVAAMLRSDESLWTIQSLRKHLLGITADDILLYHLDLDGKLRTQLEERIAKVSKEYRPNVEAELNALINRTDNYSIGEIQRAGDFVSTLITQIMTGSYANMFGNNSLYDILTQRAVTFDWRGLTPNAETLGRSLLTRVKTNAIEQNRLDLVPHIELDDEKHKSMDNLTYAKSHAFFSEIARGLHTCNLSATHRLDSIRKGGVGSELYAAAETIINNLGFVLIGRQENDESRLKELQDRYRLSNSMRNDLTSLPPYTFVYVAGETEKPRVIHTIATPHELPILETGAATARMINRPDVFNVEDIQRFAIQNNLVYLGAPELVS